jgi:hypothetical protein
MRKKERVRKRLTGGALQLGMEESMALGWF